MALKNRALLFWAAGALCMFLAIFSATKASGDAALFGYVISFLFTLTGGVFWISIIHMKE